MMNRSIPACAGEPCSGEGRCRLRRVYPRVCGGNPITLHQDTHILRSIPACAGEP